MKAVVAMDSFKGSLTSMEAGSAVKKGILRALPDAEVTVIPLADGGEGTVDAIAPFVNGITKNLTVTGPRAFPIKTKYIYSSDSRTAYIEMAESAGLTLIPPEKRNPYFTSTYGVGEVMKDAIRNGAEKLVICIGGSATNDGGAGMLQALGASLTDKNGDEIRFGALGLRDLCAVDLSGLITKNIQITVACDVTNPLCGPDGASHVYGPQKGASYEECCEMDKWLELYAKLCGFDPFEKGTGAAGGMSFALKNILGASLESGAGIVMKITGAEDLIRNSDIVVTGEGRMDSQTVNGKAPYMILEAGKKYGKPVYGICGVLGDGYEECLKAGFKNIAPLAVPSMVASEAIGSVEEAAFVMFSSLENS